MRAGPGGGRERIEAAIRDRLAPFALSREPVARRD
jgi:hypothetical protein